MHRSWLVVCLALAACDNAVVLEVHTAKNVPASEVTLFIGLGQCGDCPGIQPPSVPLILPGRVYFRDDSNDTARTLTAKVNADGVATFRLESGVSDTFDLAVAVDSNQRSAAVINSLPLNEAARYRVDLREANVGGMLGLKPALSTTTGNFVGIWSPPSGIGTCIGFETWMDGDIKDRLFIVPAEDLDCDGRGDQNMECAPYAFDGTGLPTFDKATCTVALPAAMDAGKICWLGGAACDERSGMTFDCLPTRYCLPDSYCDGVVNPVCATIAGPINVNTCLFNGAPSGKLKCEIAFQPQSDNLHAHLCESSFEFDLLPQRTANSPIKCVEVPDNHLMLARPPMGEQREFEEKIMLATKDNANMNYPFEFGIHYNYNDCTYKVQLNGEKALGATFPIEKTIFAQFWTLQSGARLNKLLVPIELTFTNDCARGSSCMLVADESLTNCALR